MPLNYSKWDALELSDDSDVECHPAIDRESYIRSQQSYIHQQRERRKLRIERLKWKGGLNATLLERIQELLTNTQKEGVNHLRESVAELSAQGHGRAPSSQELPRTNRMIFNLMSQILHKIRDTRPADEDKAAEEELKFHLTRLANREKERKVELEKEETEARKHITSEDIRDGFDVSHVHRDPVAGINEPTSGSSQSNSTDEDPKDSTTDSTSEGPGATSGKLTASAREFAKIESSDYSASYIAIQKDPSLFTDESTTDALLDEALNAEMKGRKTYAKNCVHQGLLLRKCGQLFDRGRVAILMRRLRSGEMTDIMIDDTDLTYEDIAERASFMKQQEQFA